MARSRSLTSRTRSTTLYNGGMDRLIEYAGHHSFLAAAAVLMALVIIGYELRTRAQTFAGRFTAGMSSGS